MVPVNIGQDQTKKGANSKDLKKHLRKWIYLLLTVDFSGNEYSEMHSPERSKMLFWAQALQSTPLSTIKARATGYIYSNNGLFLDILMILKLNTKIWHVHSTALWHCLFIYTIVQTDKKQ